MISWRLFEDAARIVAENPLLARLTLLSIELAVLAAGVGLLIWLLRIRAPRLRALLWLLVLAKPIVGLAIGTPLPLFQVEQPAAVQPVAIEFMGTAELDALLARQLKADQERLASRPEGAVIAASTEQAPGVEYSEASLVAATSEGGQKSLPLGTLLVGSWLAGVAGFVGIAIYGQIRIRRLCLSGTAPREALSRRFQELARGLGLKRVPCLRISNELECPALVGLVRPVVLLPGWMVEEASRERLDWLLRHELMHWKLSDPVALVVRRVSEVLFYFHPAVWWSGRKWEEAMELACDRALLQSEADARTYAEQLYQVLEKQQARQRLLCAGLFATRTQIGKRIAALLSNPFGSPARLSTVSLTGLLIMALLSLGIGLGFKQISQAQGVMNPYTSSDEEPAEALTGVLPKTPENPLGVSEEVQEKFTQVGASFRMISTALASYHVDWNKGAPQLHSLTTPISYLKKIPDDPFGEGPLEITFAEGKLVFVRSLGPDGDADEGEPIDTADPGLDGDLQVAINGATGFLVPPDDKAIVTYISGEEVTQWKKAQESQLEEDVPLEERIKRLVRRTRADLRSLHVALEAYHVDHETYPDIMRQLTTPIAYMTSFFQDPFADGAPEKQAKAATQPTPDPGHEYLKITLSPEYTELRLYSVGPDGIDQQGELMYDPTNGTISAGDIVRRSELSRYYRISDPELRKRVEQQMKQLETLKAAVEAWYLANRGLPERLEQLTGPTPFIKEVPKDMFLKEGPVSYYLDKKQGMATIYSFGPDGDDDGGEKEIRGLVRKGEVPDGDLMVQISLEELKKHYTTEPKQLENDPMMKALLELKKKDGRDNAFIYYQRASRLMPDVPRGVQTDLIREVLEQGWSEKANMLLPYLATFQPMFEEIRKGVALDYAMGIGWEEGPGTPVPNFLAGHISAKMLCVEGRYLESQGKYEEALENYLTALSLGRDYSAPEGTLISHLISIALESIALKQIHRLAVSEHLDRDSLEQVRARLKLVEDTQGTMVEAFRSETKCFQWVIKAMRERNPEITKGLAEELGVEKVSDEQLAALTERLEVEHKQLWDLEIQFMETPYWERDQVAHEKQREAMIARFHQMVTVPLPNFLTADVRWLVTRSKLLETQLATGLAMYKLDKGKNPQRLTELIPDYIERLPTDPFSGASFSYQPAADGTSYALYGVGPDRKNEKASILYDPTNGTISGGDVFFK